MRQSSSSIRASAPGATLAGESSMSCILNSNSISPLAATYSAGPPFHLAPLWPGPRLLWTWMFALCQLLEHARHECAGRYFCIDFLQSALPSGLSLPRHSISDTSPNAATHRAEVDRIIQELERQLRAQHPHAIGDPWGFASVGLESVVYMPASGSAHSSSAREINSR
jgi:hypothetical protein